MKYLAFIIGLFFLSNISLAQDKHVEHLTLDSFKSKIFDWEKNKEWKYEGEIPAIIDFYADWCAPCRMVAPIMEELAKEYEGKIKIYKVDTEAQRDLSMALGIQSLPSLLFIPMDGSPQMTMGFAPKDQFVSYIDEILKVSK